MSSNIPPSILARKIIEQCPELNISEAQLVLDIQAIFKEYNPYEQIYGVSSKSNEIDAELAKTHTCSFCKGVGAYYRGWKSVIYPYEYKVYFMCRHCGHTETI